MSSHAKLSTSRRLIPGSVIIIAASALNCRSGSEQQTEITPPLDSVVRNVSLPVIDSGSILISRPDSNDSIRAAGPLVALNDRAKTTAVPIPNAWSDSTEILRQRSLDSMLVKELNKSWQSRRTLDPMLLRVALCSRAPALPSTISLDLLRRVLLRSPQAAFDFQSAIVANRFEVKPAALFSARQTSRLKFARQTSRSARPHKKKTRLSAGPINSASRLFLLRRFRLFHGLGRFGRGFLTTARHKILPVECCVTSD